MKQATQQEAKQLLSKGVLSVKAYALSAPQPGIERANQDYNIEDFIPWFDSDNLFPQHINERARLSTTHSRILSDKVNYIIGDGMMTDGGNKALGDYLNNCNAQGEDLPCVLNRLATDYCTFGNAFLYVIQSGGFTAISHIDATYIRVSKDGKGVFFSRGFNARREYRTVEAFKPAFIPFYPNFQPVDGTLKEAGAQKHAIIHIKDYAPGYYWYGQIDYYAAYYSGWLDVDYHIPKFNLSRFHNQFKPSGLMVIAGRNINDRQAEKIQNEIRDNYTGEGTDGKLIVAVVNDENAAPKFVPFDDAPDGAFGELQQIANENIILAHGWHPALVLQQPGKLTNSTDIIAAFEQVYNTVIKRKQAELLRPVKRVLTDAGFKFKDITISTPSPVSFAGTIDPSVILTIDEQRGLIGFEALPEGGDKLLKKAAPPQAATPPEQQQTQEGGDNGNN